MLCIICYHNTGHGGAIISRICYKLYQLLISQGLLLLVAGDFYDSVAGQEFIKVYYGGMEMIAMCYPLMLCMVMHCGNKLIKTNIVV